MRKQRKPTVSAEDLRLFADAVGPVRRIAAVERADERPQPEPEPRQFLLDEARVAQELMQTAIDPAAIEVGEELSYLKDGHSPQMLRRLKRGYYSVADEIDLHQMTTAVARAAVKEFLDSALRRGQLCVKII